eukprot:4158618-Ditylum_brightwellii.AAC.1
MLTHLNTGGKVLTVVQLHKIVVSKNLPGREKVKYIEQGGKKMMYKDDIKKKLKEADVLKQKFQASCDQKRPKSQNNKDDRNRKHHNDGKNSKSNDFKKSDKKVKEKATDGYHLPNHYQNWKDYKNNPRSDSYKGTN